MEDIKFGDYVRNEDGYIEKISSFDKLTNIYKDEKGILRKWEGEDVFGNEYSTIILKHSPNIIDLIEVGDYVNGKEVIYDSFDNDIEIFDNIKHKCIGVSISNDNSVTWTVFDTEIKSIVTKEQFNSIKYEV